MMVLFLLLVPTLPLIVFGICLLVVGLTPSGEIGVIYLGVGLAALSALLLTALPLHEVRRRQHRLWWSAAVIITAIIAYVFPSSTVFANIGIACILAGFLLRGIQLALERRLTARELLRYHVRRSDGIDYAAIFDDANGHVSKTDICHQDGQKLKWQMERFALPGSSADQVAVWDAIALRIHESLLQLDPSFAASGQGANVRVVFDTDMGGFIYTRLHSGRFLFAAALDQVSLNDDSCDRDVQNLVHAIMTRSSAQGIGN
jgi:hypothetical protein